MMCASPCGFVRGICARCAPDIAALLGWLRSICVSPCGSVAAFGLGSRLLFDALRQTGRLAVSCVPIPPWVEIAGSAFSWCRCGYLPWRVHFGFVRFFMAFSTGNRDVGNGVTRGTGLAARRLCVFAQSHWPCNAFRREYVGAARPKPAPKSLRLSGLSSGAGRVRKCVSRGGAVLVRIRAAVIRVHGKTRRTPIYGSAGRAV